MPTSTEYQIGICLAAVCLGPILLICGACLTLESWYCQNTWKASPAKVIYAGDFDCGVSQQALIYEYNVDGESFKNSCVDRGLLSSFLGFSQNKAVKTFPVGSDITIYYDPEAPRNALLWNGIPSEGPVEIILGGLLFFGAIVGLQKFK